MTWIWKQSRCALLFWMTPNIAIGQTHKPLTRIETLPQIDFFWFLLLGRQSLLSKPPSHQTGYLLLFSFAPKELNRSSDSLRDPGTASLVHSQIPDISSGQSLWTTSQFNRTSTSMPKALLVGTVKQRQVPKSTEPALHPHLSHPWWLFFPSVYLPTAWFGYSCKIYFCDRTGLPFICKIQLHNSIIQLVCGSLKTYWIIFVTNFLSSQHEISFTLFPVLTICSS